MSETSKNKIYYNDDENSTADVLADMKKMAESIDDAIENSKYDDTQIKKSISDVEEKQAVKDTEQDSKIVELQNEKAELEKELKEAQEDFYQNSIRGQASGEYIHVEDSSNCRSIIGIGGNHEQETREGYNLLDFNVTQDGRVTVNQDGTITINGLGGFSINLKEFEYKKGVTYKTKATLVSGTYTSSDPNHIGIMTPYGDNEWLANNIFRTYTFLEDKVRLTLWVGANCVFNNATFEIYSYEGTEDKPYEQYGVSPSPDYPSEIKTVGSNENLLENKAITQTINGVTFTVNKDGSVMANGPATTNTTFKINNDIVPKNISNLILSGCPNNGSESTYDLKIELYKNSVWTKVLYDFGNGVDTGDLSEYTSCKISITIRKDYNANNLIFKPKLEKGSKVTPYSTYRMGSVGIDVVNKNLLDKNLIDRNISYTYGIIGEVPKPQKGLKYRGALGVENAIEIKPNTNYVITVSAGIKFAVAQLESNLKSLGDTGWLLSAKSPYILTTQHNAKYIGINFGKDDNSNFTDSEWDSFLNGYLQLEAETTATDFVEHQSQSAIMPVQKEMLQGDYFDFDNEEEVHIWNKLVLTGDEEIMYSIAQGDYYLFQIRKNDAMRDIPFVCNKFINASNWGVDNSRESINNQYNNGTLMQFKVLSSRLSETSANGVKLWLKAQYDAVTPVVIYYKLQTPTRLAFIDEQKAVAKELNNARTYKNVTNITTDSIAILDLDYAKDLETLLNNIQALAVNNASEGV